MDIKEIQERRKLLEENIIKNLEDFEAETGLMIESIDLDRMQIIGEGSRIRTVAIKVNL